MRHAGPVRRELGIRTVFNFAGPLANPAGVKRQVVGVADGSMAPTVARVLLANGAERAMVVFGHDGLDELTVTGPSTVLEIRDGFVVEHPIEPEALGLKVQTHAPAGRRHRRQRRARPCRARRRAGAHRDIVVLNAAAGLVVAGVVDDIADGVLCAGEAIDNGRRCRETRRARRRVTQAAAATQLSHPCGSARPGAARPPAGSPLATSRSAGRRDLLAASE